MVALSNAESALLGLLSEQPMYPYQIEQQVKYRDMRFWTDLSMSSIYKLLRKVEKEGLVKRTDRISPENRLQKMYELSARGKTSLVRKLEELLTVPEHMRWQVDIGIYNSSLLGVKQRKNALKKYRKSLEEKAEGYKKLLQFLKDSGCPKHRFAVAIRPVFLLEAEMKWVDSFME